MKLDPETTVATLLAAIPSSMSVLKKFGIVSGDENKTLRQVCDAHGIDFDRFLSAMNEINWKKEVPMRDAPEKR
ncbi:MAG: hypothetical protein WB676_30095 [Bryobacteraceae bacterium]